MHQQWKCIWYFISASLHVALVGSPESGHFLCLYLKMSAPLSGSRWGIRWSTFLTYTIFCFCFLHMIIKCTRAILKCKKTKQKKWYNDILIEAFPHSFHTQEIQRKYWMLFCFIFISDLHTRNPDMDSSYILQSQKKNSENK